MSFSDTTSTSTVIAQGGAATIVMTFVNESLVKMLPFMFVAVALIITDLYFGIRAAKHRDEEVRMSKAIRRTVGKSFDYICWIIVSASLSVAFNAPAIEWGILAIVMGNEVISIITNYYSTRGLKISGLRETLVKWLGGKLDVDTSDIHIEEHNHTK